MELLEFVIFNFKAGGVFMYAILLALACGTAVMIERTLTLFLRSRIDAKSLWRQIAKHIENDKLGEAINLCQTYKAPLAKVFMAGLKKAQFVGEPEEIRKGVEEVLLEVLPTLEKRVHYLYSLSNVSTLLGLLGTVVGLIRSFTAVSMADPSQKSVLLASGISLALNNTAFGLIVAILLMVSYSVMQSRVAKLGAEVDEYSMKLINLLTSRPGKPQPAVIDERGTKR
ncbi:MAG: MotA/TolQ/ExbB proton channel family protein [Nitrospira sp.]|nr:MotA/TolQ/ExbB proton channel family protein [Nitrospira sp.]